MTRRAPALALAAALVAVAGCRAGFDPDRDPASSLNGDGSSAGDDAGGDWTAGDGDGMPGADLGPDVDPCDAPVIPPPAGVGELCSPPGVGAPTDDPDECGPDAICTSVGVCAPICVDTPQCAAVIDDSIPAECHAGAPRCAWLSTRAVFACILECEGSHECPPGMRCHGSICGMAD